MKCQRWLEHKDRHCLKDAVPGRNYCYKHGGNTRAGTAHHNFKDGKQSKFLLSHLQGAYEEARQDPLLLDLQDEIALVRVRIQELLKQGESGVRWKDVAEKQRQVDEAWRAVDDALRRTRRDASRQEREQAAQDLQVSLFSLQMANEELGSVVKQGLHDWKHWDELVQRIEQESKLIDKERKYRLDKRFVVTQEQLVQNMTEVVGVLTRNIKDKRLLNRIGGELNEIARRELSPN